MAEGLVDRWAGDNLSLEPGARNWEANVTVTVTQPVRGALHLLRSAERSRLRVINNPVP
jgi:hypothetical protein